MEYQRSRRIQASPEAVFAFVADVRNLPNYLPSAQSAEMRTKDRVQVQGANDDGAYEDDGWLRVDADRHRIEWGDDEHDYSGWMTITDADDGATEVITHLSFTPRVDQSGRPLSGERAVSPDPIEQGLEAAMDSLRNLIEGRGGKVEPATPM